MIVAYDIGIRLAVTSNVASAVGQINTALSGMNGQMAQLNQHMRSLHELAAGHMLQRVGTGLLGGLRDAVTAGADLNTEFTRTLMLGGQIAAHANDMRADALAFSQRYPNADPAQFFRMERELTPQVGWEEAHRVTPMLSMMSANLAFMSGKPGGEREALDAYRTLEAVGGLYNDRHEFDEARFIRYTNALNASLVTSGGLTSVADMRQAARQAGPSIIGMDPEALFPYLSEAGIQMGHSRAGTASMSFSAQMAGGIMTRRTAEGMERAHLLGHNEYNVGRGGSVVLTPEARTRLARDTADQLQWVTNSLIPATAGKPNSEMISIMMGMFGRQTTQRLMTDLVRNNPQFWRARENAAAQQQDQGVQGAYNTMNAGSMTANMSNATAAWRGFEQAVAEAVAPQVISGLQSLTETLHAISKWSMANPNATRYMTGFATALGGLVTVTSTFMIVRATLALAGFSSVMQGFAAVTGLPLLAAGLRGVAGGFTAILAVTGLAELGLALTAIAAGLAAVYAIAQHAPEVFRTPEAFGRSEQQLDQLRRQQPRR